MNSITLQLNGQEQAALHHLLDIALRHSGIGALDVVTHFKAKIEAATADAGASRNQAGARAAIGGNAKAINPSEDRKASNGS